MREREMMKCEIETAGMKERLTLAEYKPLLKEGKKWEDERGNPRAVRKNHAR